MKFRFLIMMLICVWKIESIYTWYVSKEARKRGFISNIYNISNIYFELETNERDFVSKLKLQQILYIKMRAKTRQKFQYNFKRKFNFFQPEAPTCGALPVPYVPVRVTRGALIAHRYTFEPYTLQTSQYRRTFIPLSVSLWNALVDPVYDDVGLAGFKSRSNAFFLA